MMKHSLLVLLAVSCLGAVSPAPATAAQLGETGCYGGEGFYIEDRGNGVRATYYASGRYVVTYTFTPQDYPGDDRYSPQTVVVEEGWGLPREANVDC